MKKRSFNYWKKRELANQLNQIKDEKVHTLLATHSINGRMVGSVLIMAAMNKVLIELSRHVKDIMGIPWDPEL